MKGMKKESTNRTTKKETAGKPAKKMVKKSLKNVSAYNKFLEMVDRQGGNIKKLQVNKKVQKIKSTRQGVITSIDALEFGKLSVSLGAGRVNKEDLIDYSVGIYLEKLVGQKVRKGDVLARIYSDKTVDASLIEKYFTIE